MTTTDRSTMASRNLIEGLPEPRYAMEERHLNPGSTTPFFRQFDGTLTYLVMAGSVELQFFAEDGILQSRTLSDMQGWHAPAGSLYRLSNSTGDDVVLMQAGVGAATVSDTAVDADAAPTGAGNPCLDVSTYTVEKPWGHEVWYTQNLVAPAYAVKQIHMTSGNKSSLHSHQWKMETNHVLSGEVTVLNGTMAPSREGEPVDAARIPRSLHGPASGWSSAPNVLHRVIAESDYTSIEVSTPELYDVIRWADDSGRGSGRLAGEHKGGRGK